jgi:hypothetical protein
MAMVTTIAFFDGFVTKKVTTTMLLPYFMWWCYEEGVGSGQFFF